MEFFLQTIGILKSIKVDFISELPSVVKILANLQIQKILRQTARLYKQQINNQQMKEQILGRDSLSWIESQG